MEATPSPADREVFAAFVLRYQAAICAIAYAVLRDRARSEEVAQDALLIAWRDRDRIAPTPSWVCGIARNLARNVARRRREVVMEREPATEIQDVRDQLILREQAEAALAKLPAKYRDAIALYYGSDESYAEVAAALAITEAAARQRVHRARERLQQRLPGVEATLRSIRPGAAFTAAVIAAWVAGRTPSASAATVPATAPPLPWLVPAVGAAALLASTVGIALAIRAGSTQSALAPRALDSHETVRRFPVMARAGLVSASTPPALPMGTTPALAPATPLVPTSPPSPRATIDLDFIQAPVDDLVQLFAYELATPIWSTLEPAKYDFRAKDEPTLEALDRLLVIARATRTEVAAIQIVEGGATDAASLGGERMSISVEAEPLNRVLALIEPKLGMPIARVGRAFGVVTEDGQVVEQWPVTLHLTDLRAGLVLQRALEQTGHGFEHTTGFVLTPN